MEKEMIKIPAGKTVYMFGKIYKGEVPKCLSKYLPKGFLPKVENKPVETKTESKQKNK